MPTAGRGATPTSQERTGKRKGIRTRVAARIGGQEEEGEGQGQGQEQKEEEKIVLGKKWPL